MNLLSAFSGLPFLSVAGKQNTKAWGAWKGAVPRGGRPTEAQPLPSTLSTSAEEGSFVPKDLSERKKKSAQERCQAEEEMDEIRKTHQEELDRLRQLLKKARVSTDQAAAEQVMGSGRCGEAVKDA